MRLISVILCLTCGFACFAQKDIVIGQSDFIIPDSCVNRYDPDGKDTGIWIEKAKQGYFVSYFKAGKVHGVDSGYTGGRTGTEGSFFKFYDVYYDNGLICGPFVMYHENGVMAIYISDISRLEDGERYDTRYSDDTCFIYKGYEVDYDECGRIKAEGLCIFGKDYFIDSEPVGDWKEYNGDGTYTIVNKGRRLDK